VSHETMLAGRLFHNEHKPVPQPSQFIKRVGLYTFNELARNSEKI